MNDDRPPEATPPQIGSADVPPSPAVTTPPSAKETTAGETGLGDGQGWEPFDPAIKTLWIINAGISFTILLLSGGVLFVVGWLRHTAALWLGAAIGTAILLALLAILARWHVRWRYAATAWRLDAAVFEHRAGILWRTSVAIPLNRLQHVDLQSGPLDRALGIATLKLFTAGTRNAVHEVAGLGTGRARALRDSLISTGGPRGANM